MRNDYKPILKLALKGFQWICWLGYGVAVSMFLAMLFGVMPLMTPLMLTMLPWFVRGVSLVMVFVATAALLEAVG